MINLTCGAPRRVDVNGRALQLHEWDEPRYPAVLLLHSVAAHGHWWDWSAPRLAERHHVFALDFRGHGASSHARPPSYRFTDHVGDVIAVLDVLGWRSLIVVGHSMGAYVGALLAASHPDRIRALVIADMLTVWPPELARHAQGQAERPPREFATRAEAASGFRLTPSETAAPRGRLGHLGKAGVVERRPGTWQPAFDRHVFLHPPVDPWPFLPQIQTPTLVVCGSRSTVMDRDAAQRVATTVQRGESAELPRAYHHLVLDDPDGFASLVLAWIARVSR